MKGYKGENGRMRGGRQQRGGEGMTVGGRKDMGLRLRGLTSISMVVWSEPLREDKGRRLEGLMPI